MPPRQPLEKGQRGERDPCISCVVIEVEVEAPTVLSFDRRLSVFSNEPDLVEKGDCDGRFVTFDDVTKIVWYFSVSTPRRPTSMDPLQATSLRTRLTQSCATSAASSLCRRGHGRTVLPAARRFQ